MPDPAHTPSHLILGAGCAGLALAVALTRAGVPEPIVLLDRRRDYPDDRTWCFWDTGGLPFADLAAHRWNRWSVTTPTGRATATSARHPYVHVSARDYYDACHTELAEHPNVELRLDEPVLELTETPHAVEVRTSRREYRVPHAYDAMGAGSPRLRHRPAGDVELAQHFLGQVVESDTPAFDPAEVTLMDFRLEQRDGLHFMYVLPFSDRRALIEDTYVGTGSVPAVRRRAVVAGHLAREHDVHAFRVLKEERGRIAMSTARSDPAPSTRITAVGAAGGAVRASSGYAFVRLQRHCAAVAAAVAHGHPPPRRLSRPRHDELDRIFLRALAHDPGGFPEHFRRMVARVPADAFARFMTDASSPQDELRVIAALPKAPFATAALRGRRRRLGALAGRRSQVPSAPAPA